MRNHLTENEAAAEIRTFEKRTGAFEKKVRGTSLWQLIRFDVSVRLQGINLAPKPVGRQRLVRGVLNGLWDLVRLPRSEVLGKTFDSAIRRSGPNGFQDIYFDDIRPVLGNLVTMSSCDVAGYDDKRRRAVHRPVFDDTSVIVLSAVLGRLLPLVRNDTAFNGLARDIADASMSDRYSPETLRRMYNVFAWRVKMYRFVLRRLRTRVVLCPDSGQFALMRAAELEGVAFVEMQHGLFSGAHPNALPDDMTAHEISGVVLPAKLAVYGQFSTDQLKRSWLGANGRIVPVGAAFVAAARKLRQTKFLPNDVPQIVLTTQGIARQALANFIKEFADHCTAHFSLLVKLHPAFDSDGAIYRSLLGSDNRFRIIEGSSPESTHDLIARSDLHISISSACHFDALGMGTPTGVLAMETHQSVIDVLKHTGAFLIESPVDLARIVSGREFPEVPDSTSNYFFEADIEKRLPALINNLSTP